MGVEGGGLEQEISVTYFIDDPLILMKYIFKKIPSFSPYGLEPRVDVVKSINRFFGGIERL